MNITTYADLERVFLTQIIPLLQEYFYNDWEKIQLVFGDLEEKLELRRVKQIFSREVRYKIYQAAKTL